MPSNHSPTKGKDQKKPGLKGKDDKKDEPKVKPKDDKKAPEKAAAPEPAQELDEGIRVSELAKLLMLSIA